MDRVYLFKLFWLCFLSVIVYKNLEEDFKYSIIEDDDDDSSNNNSYVYFWIYVFL